MTMSRSDPDNNPAHNFYRETLEILERKRTFRSWSAAPSPRSITPASRATPRISIFFVMESDLRRAFDAFNRRGIRTEVAFSHWLGKAYDKDGGNFVDMIFNSGNGLCKVDESWFDRAPPGALFGRPVKFCPVEESIWQKAFIMERERYDGADIAHLLHAQSDKLDWNRLLKRFGKHWRVLFSYITLFGYIYPTERTKIPDWVQRKLSNQFACEIGQDARGESVCAGTFLSRAQFLVDVDEWGYRDVRTPDIMSPEDVERWTAAAAEEKKS